MPLEPGTKLGPYEIVAPIGAGGMGEVYKAKDTRLDRTVAIKVLPAHVASHPEVRQRFEREARAVSSLNHPNICTLYDIGSENGIDFMVMEHIQGQTLADRLKKGALPFDDALQHGIEIADALNKAHRQGVVHRDLKPGNIMLTKSGSKLLDFGLAKMSVAGSGPDLSAAPTEQKSLTQPGAILGTFQYMAPEQLEGKEADTRTDIFAFGAVVYEMVTGRRAFEGKSQASLIGAILKDEPPPISTVQTTTPPALDHVIQRCLSKDPDDRWQSAGDVTRELEWIVEGASPASESPHRARATGISPRKALLLTAVGVLAGALISALVMKDPNSVPTPSLMRFEIPLRDQVLSGAMGAHLVAASPDGKHVAYVANNQLHLRALDRLGTTPIAGTEGVGLLSGRNPFFSPDGQWLGFWADGKLRKVSVSGGAPVTLCDFPQLFFGATWGPDNRILLGAGFGGIYSVSGSGGAPEQLVAPVGESDAFHRPELLPGGEHVLFTLNSGGSSWDDSSIVVQSLESGERRVLIEGGTDARYSSTGHIVYARGTTILAVPFDESRLQVSGGPVPILEGVMRVPVRGASNFAITPRGSLIYIPGGVGMTGNASLVWVDRNGGTSPLTETLLTYSNPRLSPDGERLAVGVRGEQGLRDLWVYEIRRGTMTRLTFDRGAYAAWTPGGDQVAFASGRGKEVSVSDIFLKAADGSGTKIEVLKAKGDNNAVWPSSISPDGRYLIFARLVASAGGDIGVLPLTGEGQAEFVIDTPFEERHPALSPDGRWLAYTSDESGRIEVYVQPFPDLDGKWQLSTEGGTEPVWSPKGHELFYRNGDKMMAVGYEADPTFSPSRPLLLFEGTYLSNPWDANYSVTPDGQRFVMIQVEQQQGRNQINVVLNWFEELKRLVPTN